MDGLGFERFVIGDIEILDDASDEGNLVVDVVDDEIAIEAKGGGFNAKDLDGDAVESAHIGHK